MTSYADLDNDYLVDAIDQITAALEYATGIQTNVTNDPADSMTGPFWALEVTNMLLDQRSDKWHLQTYDVSCFYVHEPSVQGERRGVYRGVYSLLTRAFNYLFSHKQLIFASDDTPIPYLVADGVTVTVRAINNPMPGWAIVISLPFRLALEQAH